MKPKNLVDNNALLHGFCDNVRTLQATIIDLEFVRGWREYELFLSANDASHKPIIWEKIMGVAVLSSDKIAVIGSKKTPINHLSFELYPFAEGDSLSEEWEIHKKNSGDPFKDIPEESDDSDEARLAQYLRNVHGEFDKRPPTAHAIANGNEWNLECHVPKIIFDALVSDWIQDRCRTFSIGLRFVPTLLDDKYYEYCDNVTFGVLQGKYCRKFYSAPSGKNGTSLSRENEGKDEGILHGWVTHLSWKPILTTNIDKPYSGTKADPAHTTENNLADQHETSIITPQLLQDSICNLNQEIMSLASTTRNGFIFVLLLILLIGIFDLG